MILGSSYVFYGDVYFAWNVLIKMTTLILISKRIGKKIEMSIFRMMLIAVIATIAEIVLLCKESRYQFFAIFVIFLEVPLMVFVLLRGNRYVLIKGSAWGYIFTIVINGLLEVLWNLFGNSISYIWLLIFACASAVLGYSVYRLLSRKEKGVYAIEIMHDGKRVETFGFYDSGNCLKDPFTGKGVHIVSENIIKKITTEEMNKVFVPYKALGTSGDLLEVVYIDEIIIYGTKDILKQHKIPIGIAKEELFFSKSYKMILNEEVF